MTAAAHFDLAQFRAAPSQPRTWLKEFRRATPRAQRHDLIDRTDLLALLERIEGDPAELRAAHYPFIVYLLAARGLQSPTALSPAEREAFRHRIGSTFGLDPLEVARDVTRMRVLLEHDHSRWLRLRRRQAETAEIPTPEEPSR